MSNAVSLPHYNLAVIGGGINGVGIARDAVGRGLSVYLCEKDDLANATSSASSKLIHGGLRYLEYYEFKLVAKALTERETLLNAAPHIIWPLQFILPHDKNQRPAWLVRIGLFLYDNLGKRKKLPGSKGIKFATHEGGKPLEDKFTRGFVYSDCWVQDARMVALNAMDARARGASINTHTSFTNAKRQPGPDGQPQWLVTVTGRNGEEQFTADALANAAGPWVSKVLDNAIEVPDDQRSTKNIRLVQGSHMVVPKLFEHDYAYIFQNDDGRIVFAIPYEQEFTLIGTTDLDYQGDPNKAAITEDEISYLCELSNKYFKQKIQPSDVVWSYAGVRPLYDDAAANASAATRDYVFDVVDENGKAPLLSVFGGKITTYRTLAEHACDKLQPYFPNTNQPWTAKANLPGGDIPNKDFDAYVQAMRAKYPQFEMAGVAEASDSRTSTGTKGAGAMVYRLCREYGTNINKILDGKATIADLGQHFGHTFYAAEAEYLLREEFAETAEDILWRRTKLGLHLSEGEREKFGEWVTNSYR